MKNVILKISVEEVWLFSHFSHSFLSIKHLSHFTDRNNIFFTEISKPGQKNRPRKTTWRNQDQEEWILQEQKRKPSRWWRWWWKNSSWIDAFKNSKYELVEAPFTLNWSVLFAAGGHFENETVVTTSQGLKILALEKKIKLQVLKMCLVLKPSSPL